jgi:RNA polymerase sigma-70 factor (ECF subfamily)
VNAPPPTPAEDFDAFYRAGATRLVRQLVPLVGSRAEAEDVVQEAYARAYARWSTVARYDAPEAWVRTVALRLAVSRWRRTRNAALAWRRRAEPEEALGVGPDSVALVAALRRLPEAQRVAIVLHHLMDLSVEQVAAETGAPTGTVKARLSRGRAALAPLLSEGTDLDRGALHA